MKAPNILSKQAVVYYIELFLLVAFVLGTVVLVNYIAFNNNKRFDFSPEKTFSLSSRTERILESLEHDVHATIFYDRKEGRTYQDLMQLFSWASKRFSYEFIDINKNPAKAEAFNISRKGAGILEYMGKKEKVLYFEESNIVSAIIKLTDSRVKTVRFVTGHGERNISGNDPETGYVRVVSDLREENYQVKEILLMQEQKIPDDTSILIISGPKKDFLKQELEMVDDYIKNNGRVILLCDPYPLPELAKYMETLGVKLSRDFVIDKKSKLFAMDHLTPIVIPDRSHPIAENMNDAIVFPISRSVASVQVEGLDQKTEIIAYSSPDSWAEQDTQSVYDEKAVFNKGVDINGPVPVALVSEITFEKDKTGHVIVFGDSDFITNYYYTILGNRDFFLNTVNWLSEKTESLASRPISPQAPMDLLFLTENQSRMIFWSAVVIEPLIILLIGLSVVFWRRFKR